MLIFLIKLNKMFLTKFRKINIIKKKNCRLIRKNMIKKNIHKMTSFLVLFVLSIIFFISTSFHPIHVGLNNIEYNNEKKEFNIMFKLFLNDFELAILKKYEIYLNLSKEEISKNKEIYIKKYFEKHFNLKLNEENINISKMIFYKKEIQNDAIWFYFKFPYEKSLKNIYIKNTMMTDLFKDQKNLIFFNYFDFEKSEMFNNKFFFKKYTI